MTKKHSFAAISDEILDRLVLGQLGVRIKQQDGLPGIEGPERIDADLLPLEIVNGNDTVIGAGMLVGDAQLGVVERSLMVIRVEQINVPAFDTGQQHIVPALQVEPHDRRAAAPQSVPKWAVLGEVHLPARQIAARYRQMAGLAIAVEPVAEEHHRHPRGAAPARAAVLAEAVQTVQHDAPGQLGRYLVAAEQVADCIDGKCVDVRAQDDGSSALLFAAQRAEHAGLPDTGVRDAEPVELLFDPLRGAEFLHAQLGMLMKFPADGNEIVARRLRRFPYVHDTSSLLFRLDLRAQTLQAVQRLEQRLVLLREMQADEVVDRLAEKARTRYRAHAGIMRQILAEFEIALVAELGNVEQHIIRALRVGVRDVQLVQALEKQLLFMRVLGEQVVIVVRPELQSGDNGLLKRRRRADRQEIVHLFRAVDDVRRRDDVAEAPAGDRVGLGQRRARQRALPHTRQGREVGMLVRRVDDVLVDLVGDDIGIVLFRERRDKFQLLAREHLAAGVGGVAQDHRLGVLAERILEKGRIKMEIRRHERHIDRLCARQDGIRAVVFVERGENDDLVARIGDGHHRRHHRLGAAAGRDNLSVRVDLPAHTARLLGGERLAEVLRAPGDGILMKILIGDLRHAVENLLRRFKVREALRQVDRAVLHGNARHAADDRVGEAGRAFG